MAPRRTSFWGLLYYLFVAVFAGCSNGSGNVENDGAAPPTGDSGEPPSGGANAPTYTVSVTVSGLAGDGLVLQNNGGNDVPVAANGTLTFSTGLASGSPYNVTVLTQPTNPTQVCTIGNGTGTIGNANVTDVTVTCTTQNAPRFRLSGTVSGLTAPGLVLQNNGTDNLTIDADGSFTFAQTIPSGSQYLVAVLSAPAGQTCSVANGTGTVGMEDINDVQVVCAATAFNIGVNVSGLTGSGLTLQLNGKEELQIATNGSFSFVEQLAIGTKYNVAVTRFPENPRQSCLVQNGSGTVQGPVTATVTCSNLYAIGGSVQGLSGRGRVDLQLRSGATTANKSLSSNGPFTFDTALPSGASYVVSITAQPTDPAQECTLTGQSGVVQDANVNTIGVSCRTKRFNIIAEVVGLQGNGLRLRNKSTNEVLSIAGNGRIPFPTQQSSGSNFDLEVVNQPMGPTQRCSLNPARGTVGAADVVVTVTCTTLYQIRAQVSGLEGSGLRLSVTTGTSPMAEVPVAADGTPTLASSLASGTSYTVAVAAQPTEPAQNCTVTNPSGRIGTADVTIPVSCETIEFSIGGTVAGLINPGLQLQNNGADTLDVAANGSFAFDTRLPNGSPYNVTILSLPTNPAQECSVRNGSGNVNGAPVTNVQVTCDIPSFTVGGTVSGLGFLNFGLQLQINDGEIIDVPSVATSFTFSPLPYGTPYDVTVARQPGGATCTVSNGTGTIGGSNVTDVSVTCN